MKTLSKLTLFTLALLVIVSCGSDPEDPRPLSTSKLVGTWSVTSSTTEMIVGGKTYKQYLIDVLGLSEEEATIYDEIVRSSLTLSGYFSEVEFKNDYTYHGTNEFVTTPITGEWDITEDEKTLTLNDASQGTKMAKVTKLTDTDLWLEIETGITQQPAGAPAHVDYIAVAKLVRKK